MVSSVPSSKGSDMQYILHRSGIVHYTSHNNCVAPGNAAGGDPRLRSSIYTQSMIQHM
uniref:Uncharacterized protein n=1 Tax=Solanum tuberosum TaxID=4113 RepID=M1C1Q4_SOLTU